MQAVNSFGNSGWSSTSTGRTSRPNRSPGFRSSSYTRTVAENTASGQNIGSPITAQDSDGHITGYSLSGAAAAFTVTSGGQLRTSGALNFEAKNNYSLTIRARDNGGGSASASLTVAITDVQEEGSVTINRAEAVIFKELRATLNDPDQRTSQDWQWARSSSSSGPWTDISGENSSAYTPVAADRGQHLRVTAKYDDIDDDQSAEATIGPVRDPTLASLTVSPKDIDGFHPARHDYAVGVASTVSQVTVNAQASSPTSAQLSYSTTDASSTDPGHQVNLSPGANALSIKVTDGTTSNTYTITIGKGVTPNQGWRAEKDLDTLAGADNHSPKGLWSDGTTVWVADDGEDKLLAYTLGTAARDAAKDISLDTDNSAPRGAWSTGNGTLWVADAVQAKLFGYPLSGAAATEEWTLHGNNTNPWGIWSDGSAMWVVDATQDSIYVYDLDTQARITGRDIALAPGNADSTGIRSNGLYIWVADSADGKIYSYELTGGTRASTEEFNTLTAAGNTSPAGLWSDGSTIWVTDAEDPKIYAYHVPISDNNDLRSISIKNRETIDAPRQNETYYLQGATPASITVSAQPRHALATVRILPQDADDQQEGHQLDPRGSGHSTPRGAPR